MPTVHIRYYARLRDLAGRDTDLVQMDEGSTINDLVTRAMCNHPTLAPLRSSMLVARNDEYARPQDELADGDSVDLMPPVSGG